ncbi:hypothetical protein Gohar_017529, partial [Gossypium harknessii]|nr:hypothetical protein [Gossypium harknessii]
KIKWVAASVEYSLYPIYEDQRNRFKNHSLTQDFDNLLKKTEAIRKRWQVLKDKKLTLLAEVEFFKRRQKFLMQNRTLNTLAEQSLRRLATDLKVACSIHAHLTIVDALDQQL